MWVLFVFSHCMEIYLFVYFLIELYIRIPSLLKFIGDGPLSEFYMHVLLILLDLLPQLLLLITHWHLTALLSRYTAVVADLKLPKPNGWVEICWFSLLRRLLKILLRGLITFDKLWILLLHLMSQVIIKTLLIKIRLCGFFRNRWLIGLLIDTHYLLWRQIPPVDLVYRRLLRVLI